MHVKQKRYCYGVFLIYTITTITLNPVGRCEPTVDSPQTNSHSDGADLQHDGEGRGGDLTTNPLFQPSRRRHHLDSRHRQAARRVPTFPGVDSSRDGSQSQSFASRPDLQRFRPTMVSSSGNSFPNRDKEKQEEAEWTYSSFDPRNEDCSKGKIQHVVSGKLYIAGHLEASVPNVGYLSDSAQAQGGQVRVRGQLVNGPEQSWQRLEPEVECGDDAMTLTVRRRRAAQLLLDRVNASSLALSQLPSQCGYAVSSTWRDLSLTAPYDACHVTQEDDSYVLPLLWRGTPVKMSCPVSQVQPQTLGPSSLCCSPYGMTVTLQGQSATEELRVKVRGEWTPLVLLAQQCGYTLDRRAGELLIDAPFITCGITVKDGKYTLSLQIGEKVVTLACPVSPPQTHHPLVDGPHHPARGPAEPVPETPQPFPWAPPFYLAPPYYPHPTYPLKYRSHDTHDGYNPPARPSLTPNPTTRPQPLPPVGSYAESQPVYQNYYSSYQMPPSESYQGFNVHSSPLPSTDETDYSNGAYPDLQQKEATSTSSHSENHSATQSPSSATGFPVQAEAPSLQPPSHTFNPYYHYYHHPKIPLLDPPQDPDLGPEIVTYERYPEEQPVPASHNPEFPLLPHHIHQPKAPGNVNSDQFPQHVTEAGTSAHPLPSLPQLPIQYRYNFHPYLEDKRKPSAPVVPAAQPPLPPNYPHMYYPPHKLPQSNHQQEPNHITLPPPEQPSIAPSPNHNPPPYPYYHHPYYHYYHMCHGPERLPNADNHASPSSSKEALDPLLQASASPTVESPQRPVYLKHPIPILDTIPDDNRPHTTTPTTESAYDVQNGPIHPYYYYYHHYYQPGVSIDNQEPHPAGGMFSEKATSGSETRLPSDSTYDRTDSFVRAAEEGYPSMPQPHYEAFHSPSSHHISRQHPYNPFQHPNGEGSEERPDDEMRDRLKANSHSHTPSASPCGLGLVSDRDCSSSLGCCSYPVNECTMGHHLVFAVPDSVVEPTVAPPALLSEMVGQTVVHLPLQQDHNSMHEGSPVRLMVECRSSPGSPGKVKFQVIPSPAPQASSTPTTVTVQLRIATDESFTNYHPAAQLPLSLIEGRLVYVEVGLLNPPLPGLVLLVHYCLAYAHNYASPILIYDGCASHGDSHLLPPPSHTQRLTITSFLYLTRESPSHLVNGGDSDLEDPEISFLCSMDVCSTADGGVCTVGCISRSQ